MKKINILLFSFLIMFNSCKKQETFRKNEGIIFGTTYHITYESKKDLKTEIEKELLDFDNSLSMFNKKSTLSKINQAKDSFDLKNDFKTLYVLKKSIEISNKTNGAFDITVGPLVNLWGFGFKKSDSATQEKIDSIMTFIGYKHFKIKNDILYKDNKNIILDCSAIAKGYACDVVANLLKKNNIKNFLVEIGGEITLGGVSPKNKAWRVGINRPIEDSTSLNNEYDKIISISNKGIATSGNYRNFYEKNGKKYAHTIDPKSGYPIQHSLLSATVISNNCITSDSYATAFMVMGLEKAKNIVLKTPELETILIYTGKNGEYKTYESPGISKFE